MTRQDDTLWCDGCGVEILWAPLVRSNRDYCCQDCLGSLPCKCDERTELDERRRARSADAFAEGVTDVATEG